MAGVFAPAKKYRPGSGGGSGHAPKSGGYRPPFQTKQAFGGGTQSAASRRAVSTMDRTARRAPEVMVRITGRQHGGGHLLAINAIASALASTGTPAKARVMPASALAG